MKVKSKFINAIVQINLTFLFLCTTAGCCGGATDTTEYELDQTSFDARTLKRVEGDTGIALPSGSRGLNFYYWPPIDPGFIARVEIPQTSAKLVAAEIEKIPHNGHVPRYPDGVKRWWDVLRTCEGETLVSRRYMKGGTYVNAHLCKKEADYLLYVAWFN